MLLILSILVVLVQINPILLAVTENSTGLEQPIKCTRSWFQRNLIEKDRGLTTNLFDEYKRICTQNTTGTPVCKTGDAYLTYAESQAVSQFWWIFDVFNLNNTDDCWGMYADIRTGDGTLVSKNYINFYKKDKDSLAIYKKAEKKVEYTFNLYPVPFGDKLEIKVLTPGDCENKALELIYELLQNLAKDPTIACQSDAIDFNTRNDLAVMVCRLSPNSYENRKDLILNKVRTRYNKEKYSCEFYINTSNDVIDDEKKPVNYFTPVNISLSVISLVLVISIILIVYLYFRCKKKEVARITSLNERGTLHLENVSRVNHHLTMEDEYLIIEGNTKN